jgi:DNA-binding CsgD family transcriptional regulator
MKVNSARREAPSFESPITLATSIPTGDCPALCELLSDREAEIARLVTRGLSNKEIGQHLGISPWTVATHLRRTFLKLEITRRIELCAIVATTRAP